MPESKSKAPAGARAFPHAQFKAIFDAALDAVVIMASDGCIETWNPQAEIMFGWSAADAVGRSLAATIIPERFREAHQRGLERFLECGEGPILGRRIEVLALHRAGHEFPVELTVTPLRLGGGWRFSAFVRDLTETKAAERRLAAQHSVTRILARSDSLRDAAPGILGAVCQSLGWQMAVLWTLDRNAAELRAVDLWRDPLVEVPAFETATRAATFPKGVGLPGRVWRRKEPAWIPNVIQDSNFPRARSAAAGGLHGAFGFPIMAGPEVIGVIECYSREIRPPDPAVLAMVASIGGQIGQFAERRRAEEGLRANEASYRLLFESNPEAMWVFDAETLRFLAVNEAAIRRYGYSRDEFFAMSVQDIRPPADRAKFLELRGRNPHGPIEYTELRHCRKDGTILAVDVSADSITFGDRPARLILAKDVTERKRLEEQLRQSQKMEAIGRLAGGVAHDFNNLLTVIQGYGDLILGELEPGDRLCPDVRGIKEAAERAAGLTQQLLAFSRRQVLAPEVLDLNSLAQETEKLLHRLIGEDIQIHTALAPDLGQVRAHPVQLHQVAVS
jgi:PAS domain S-box-containing protein